MIHPTAVVSKGAEIDSSVTIGPFCVIGPNVRIGKGTELKSHVVVDGWTEIGEHNAIFPFAVLGSVPQDLKYKGERTKLVIGNHNTIREAVTLNMGTVQGGGQTRIGNHNLLMSYVHLGHDCIVGDNTVLSTSVGLAGHVTVEDYAILGGMTGVAQFIRVGAYAYVAGKSGLEKDIPPYTIAVGSRPCRIRGANIVGLRRKGFEADVIQKINESVKLWIRQDVPKDQCLLEIESQYGDLDEVRGFVGFIRSSEHGVEK